MDECPHEDCFAPKIPCHTGEKTPSRCPIWTHRDDLQSASGEAGVMARVRSEEPPDETGQYWLEEYNEKLDTRRAPEMKRVFYAAGKLRIKPGPGHGKPVDEVDGEWTGPMPDPKQISERREAP